MNGFEVYKMYVALTLHFKTEDYDFFLYEGKAKTSVTAYNKRQDRYRFVAISKNYNPLTFLVGNLIFNPSDWIGDFSEKYQREYLRHRANGPYLFEQDLGYMKSNFNENFVVDTKNSIPYILKLFHEQKMSFHSLCVFESLLGCVGKWKKHPQYMIFEALALKIRKITPFFRIENDKYRVILLKRFNNFT